MIDLNNVSIDCDTYGTFMVDYYINCFDRWLRIVFFNLDKEDKKYIEEDLDLNYTKWHEIDTCECCEEYMIDNLLPYYKNHIACVIYENEEKED
jgi:hypothetical protein